MRNRWIFLLLLFLPFVGVAQPGKVYKLLADVANPEDVYILRLRHKKLTKIPEVVFKMSNLRELDLSHNRLSSVPADIVALQNLEVLNLGRNNIDSLPLEVAQLSHLVELDLSRNPLESLPEEMGYMLSLRKLVVWSTALYAVPESFADLDERLELLDMRSCQLSRDDQHAIRAILPTVRIWWDQACNCK